MLDAVADDIAIEEIVKSQFGLQLDIKQVIAREIPVSHTASATVFLTPKHHVYAYIHAHAALTLGDVMKMAKKMGLVVEAFIPPNRQKDYFNEHAEQKFRDVFPGRHNIDESELRYYRSLVLYNPALLKVSAITDGIIRQFDSHDSSQWRVAAKFAYKQITTLS